MTQRGVPVLNQATHESAAHPTHCDCVLAQEERASSVSRARKAAIRGPAPLTRVVWNRTVRGLRARMEEEVLAAPLPLPLAASPPLLPSADAELLIDAIGLAI